MVVSGRVQGVGFRYFVMNEAWRLGLKGFVRNLSRDRVEVVAEGEQADLDELVSAVRRGPEAARVDNVQVSSQRPTGEFRDFGLRASSS